jgi:hypothetical protein
MIPKLIGQGGNGEDFLHPDIEIEFYPINDDDPLMIFKHRMVQMIMST